MAPKKAKATKMALNDFLVDESLGSWADEMDNLPTAPAPRNDEDRFRRGERDFGNRFDDYASKDRENRYPPRDELPLPTAPPYTAFVGNLSFELTEADVEEFFGAKLKSVKIIRDRDEKPKGFGYVEFPDLEGLKDGLTKSGGQLNGRTVRVSVAEPPKGGSGGFDDDKFASSWRRDGPLPSSDRGFDRGGSRGGPPSRFEDAPDRGERMGMGSKFVPSGPNERQPRGMGGGPSRFNDAPPSEAETTSDWRGNRPLRSPAPPANSDRPGPPRRGSGFSTPDGPPHASDVEDVWAKGSKFAASEPPKERGGFFNRRENLKPAGEEEPSDWRSAPRKSPAPGRTGNNDRSPTGSVPSTPNISRRKLDLLPRSNAQSNAPSPISSPKSPSAGAEWRSPNGAQTPTTSSGTARSNPFGAAKPVDMTSRDKEIEEKLEKERASRLKDRSNDDTARSPSGEQAPKSQDRPPPGGTGGGGSWRDRKTATSKPSSATHSRNTSHDGGNTGPGTTTPPTGNPANKFRPQFSFAAAAGGVEVAEGEEDDREDPDGTDVSGVTNKIGEVTI